MPTRTPTKTSRSATWPRLRNQADSMCFQLEKLMKEHEAKLTDADGRRSRRRSRRCAKSTKGDNLDAIKSAVDELEQASHAFSKTLYSRVQPPPGAGGPGAAAAAGASGASRARPGGEDEAIDAEFEVKE